MAPGPDPLVRGTDPELDPDPLVRDTDPDPTCTFSWPILRITMGSFPFEKIKKTIILLMYYCADGPTEWLWRSRQNSIRWLKATCGSLLGQTHTALTIAI